MKKYIFGVALALALVVAPFVSLAQVSPVAAIPVVTKTSGVVSLVSLNGVPQLKSLFNVTVTAKGGDLYLSQTWPAIESYFVPATSTGQTYAFANGCSGYSSLMSGLDVLFDKNKYGWALLPSGKTAQYTVTLTCPVGNLFAGTYTSKVSQISYNTALNGTSQYLQLNLVSSNSQYIVGEKGPYINSTQISERDPKIVHLFGERLKNLAFVYVGGKKLEWTSQDDRQINIILPSLSVLPVGTYPVYVVSTTGLKSNSVSLTVAAVPILTPLSVKLSPVSPIASSIGASTFSVTPNIVLGTFSIKSNSSSDFVVRSMKFYLKDDFGRPVSAGLVSNLRQGSNFKSSAYDPLTGTVTLDNYDLPISPNQSVDVSLRTDIPAGQVSGAVNATLIGKSIVAVDVYGKTVDVSRLSDVTANRLNIVRSTTPTPTPILSAANSATSVLPGGYAKLRGSNLTTNITIKGATYPVLNPALSDGNKRVDFKINAKEKPGTYSVYVTGNNGVSNEIPFKVLLKTTGTTTASVSGDQVNQLANILSSLQALLSQILGN